jgi:hypothetical protein
MVNRFAVVRRLFATFRWSTFNRLSVASRAYFFFTGASFLEACDCEHCGCTPAAEYDRLPQCGQIAPAGGAASSGVGFLACATMGGLSKS